MEGDTRYKIEHMGDSFANMLDKMCSSIGECNILKKVPDAARASCDFIKKVPEKLKVPDLFKKVPSIKIGNPLDLVKKVPDTARSSARGVILTYDIHELRKKKEKIVRLVGERIVELRREAPGTSAADDETIRTLLLEIDAIDSKLEDYINERQARLYPAKGKEEAEETPAPEVQAEAVEIETEPEIQAEAIEETPASEVQAEAVETATEPEIQAEATEGTSAPEVQAEAVETETEPEAQAEAVEETPAPEEQAKTSVKDASNEEYKGGGIEILSPELADEDEDEK